MAVSGFSGVQAYPPDELIGDSALFVHVDLDKAIPAVGALHSDALIFTDYGEAWENYATAQTPERRDIADLGLGFNAFFKGLVLHANVAHRLHAAAPQSEPDPRNKVLVQAGWIF